MKNATSVSQISQLELYFQEGPADHQGGKAQWTEWQLASSLIWITGFQYDAGWYRFQSYRNVPCHSHNECFPFKCSFSSPHLHLLKVRRNRSLFLKDEPFPSYPCSSQMDLQINLKKQLPAHSFFSKTFLTSIFLGTISFPSLHLLIDTSLANYHCRKTKLVGLTNSHPQGKHSGPQEAR